MFTVTLHHLAPDLKKAGVEYSDFELAQVTEKRLRELIGSLAILAKGDLGIATPELRIAAPHGKFVIQAGDGRLRFNSWSIRVGGANLTPDQIFWIVTGTDNPAEAAIAAESFMREGRTSSRKKILLFAVLIVASNATTAWMLMRSPPKNPLQPAYRLIEAEPGERLFANAAGEYQTGVGEGHRGLKVMRGGRLHWIRYGPNGSIVEESDLTAQPAEAHGAPAMLTGDGALIEILDANTLVFFGNTYRRKAT